jgi:hypothetical protein
MLCFIFLLLFLVLFVHHLFVLTRAWVSIILSFRNLCEQD